MECEKFRVGFRLPHSNYTPTLASKNGARNTSVIRLRRTRFERECGKSDWVCSVSVKGYLISSACLPPEAETSQVE